jgi:DNA-directed RNA polymerase subunit RPC12/RpoP
MQKYKCKACGRNISEVQFKSGGGHCGKCLNKKPSPMIRGRKLW